MSTPSGKQLSVGLRRAVIFALDAEGFPLASGTQAYEGIEVIGPKAFTLSVPDARRITHTGNDRVLAIDYLPPTEGVTGELRVAATDIPAKAVLTGVNVFTAGEASMLPWGTDQQGFETDVALLLFQQSLDAISKSRRWKFYLIPKARTIPSPASMDENPAEDRYQVAPNPTAYHLWGTALADNTEGATEMALAEGMATNRPNVVAFLADGAETDFLLPVNKPAVSIDKIAVWVDGVLQTTELGTLTTTTIPFDVAPELGAIIVVYYEY
jgi:hypothetical protein